MKDHDQERYNIYFGSPRKYMRMPVKAHDATIKSYLAASEETPIIVT